MGSAYGRGQGTTQERHYERHLHLLGKEIGMNAKELSQEIDFNNRVTWNLLNQWTYAKLTEKVDFIPEPDAQPPF
jgi:hypothetical protein